MKIKSFTEDPIIENKNVSSVNVSTADETFYTETTDLNQEKSFFSS